MSKTFKDPKNGRTDDIVSVLSKIVEISEQEVEMSVALRAGGAKRALDRIRELESDLLKATCQDPGSKDECGQCAECMKIRIRRADELITALVSVLSGSPLADPTYANQCFIGYSDRYLTRVKRPET